MSLPKVTLEELTEDQATVSDAVTETGRDAVFVGKAIRDAGLEAVATVATGRPGRPPRVFNRTELMQAVTSAIHAEEAAKAAQAVQTNTETIDTDSQVA